MKDSEILPSEGNRSVPGLIDQMPVSIVKAKATMEFESRVYMKSVCKKFISQGSPALLFQFPLLRFHYTDAYRAWAPGTGIFYLENIRKNTFDHNRYTVFITFKCYPLYFL